MVRNIIFTKKNRLIWRKTNSCFSQTQLKVNFLSAAQLNTRSLNSSLRFKVIHTSEFLANILTQLVDATQKNQNSYSKCSNSLHWKNNWFLYLITFIAPFNFDSSFQNWNDQSKFWIFSKLREHSRTYWLSLCSWLVSSLNGLYFNKQDNTYVAWIAVVKLL